MNLDTKIEDNSRAFKLQKANFDSEVNTAVMIFLKKKNNKIYFKIRYFVTQFVPCNSSKRKKEDDKHENCKGLKGTNFAFKRRKFFFSLLQKAEAQLAYELQAAKIQQRIRQEEIQIQVILV